MVSACPCAGGMHAECEPGHRLWGAAVFPGSVSGAVWEAQGRSPGYFQQSYRCRPPSNSVCRTVIIIICLF